MVLSTNSNQLVDVELQTGLIRSEMTANPLEELVPKWSIQSSGISAVENLSWEWHIDRAGFFTLRFTDGETLLENSSLAIDLKFHNCWDLALL